MAATQDQRAQHSKNKDNRMYSVLKTIAIGMVLALSTSSIASAATPEAVVGTWALNLQKSTFSPGPAPKSQTRTYAETADGITLTMNGVAADGSPMSGMSTFKYDGKDYAISGSPDYDSLNLKRVNQSTVTSVQKKDGKVIGSTTRTLSAKGKVLTLTSKGKTAKGEAFHNVMVFDKQ